MPILPDIPKVELAIVDETNAFRAVAKLAPVKANLALSKAAHGFAQFLASSTLFSHEADGRRPVDRIKAAGYAPCAAAENLAWRSDSRGFETMQLAGLLVEGWKQSPGHRKNLLMEHATETGIAVVKARHEEKYFAVQLFARPETMRYTFRLENTAQREVSYTVGDQRTRIAPRQVVTHTACVPAEVVIETRAAGLLAKPVVARYQARDGHVYRLTSGKGGEIAVEVATR
jgi:hypothetical protein